ncbi:hypothetical protein [Polynucleobacter sp. HIN5]|uniref:hypothetical protein n=1 Tax=Polynucleobacter sp. HIN5 TaxID=3047864 RepID=UPI0025729A35|nr:hypothetical protein [Polynucleobacter sp. HIN5]BEI33211.1 hypothetical protein PHIN5_05790 [Polynucleobacter sp. HIN5]
MNKQRIISIEGDLYALSILTVSDGNIERLVKARDREEDFWTGLEEFEEELSGGAVISGFLVRRRASELRVFVGNQEFSLELKSVLDNHPVALKKSKFILEPNSHYLIYEEWFSNGKFIHSLDVDIDLSNLQLGIEEQDLPNGSKKRVLNITYGDEDLQFQESTPEDVSLYVFKSDGERIDLL